MTDDLVSRFLAACVAHVPGVDPVDVLDAVLYPDEADPALLARIQDLPLTEEDEETLASMTDSGRDDMVEAIDEQDAS